MASPVWALGIALEAARLVGVPLFSEDDIRVSMDRDLTAARLALLQQAGKNPTSDE